MCLCEHILVVRSVREKERMCFRRRGRETIEVNSSKVREKERKRERERKVKELGEEPCTSSHPMSTQQQVLKKVSMRFLKFLFLALHSYFLHFLSSRLKKKKKKKKKSICTDMASQCNT